MFFATHCGLRLPALSLLFIISNLAFTAPALSQSRAADETDLRYNHPEIAVTIKDTSGQVVTAPATVKIYHSGLLSGEAAASKGRAFFILNALGYYSITVDASGYKSAQTDMDVSNSIKYEVDVNLQRELSSNEAAGVPGRPLLAPKAKEALDKGLQAISANKLSDAEKYVSEAVKLAPGHPDVLFVQGVLFLSQRNWAQAQNVLEKASQMDPNNAHICSALGMALTDQGKYDEAITPLEKSLQLDSEGNWETHWALGKAYYHHQQYDQALKTSQLALAESNGKAPQIQLLVAQSLTAVGRYDDAAQTLRDFIKTHSDRPEAATAQRWLNGLEKNGKIHATKN